MKQRSQLLRKVPLRKRGEKRASLSSIFTKVLFALRDRAKREREADRRESIYGEKADFIRTLSCVACRTMGRLQLDRTVAAHAAKTRGAGGDNTDIVPLCVLHEIIWHTMGCDTFDARYGTDLKASAIELESLWQRIKGEV